LAPNSATSGGRSVGTVRSQTQATEFSFFFIIILLCYEGDPNVMGIWQASIPLPATEIL
jgi:hypothetical protein